MDRTVGGVLGVFAHPDDESLSAGGVLARAASLGVRTEVVTTTWSEDTHRARELATALTVLRAGTPKLLGYADAFVPESAPRSARLLDARLDEVVSRLVSQIREFRPTTVITHDAYGGVTGHPDHIHTYRVTALAVEAAGMESAYREKGEPWSAPELLLATHPRSMLRQITKLLGAPERLFFSPDTEVSERIDVTPWLNTKVDAILAHRSEVERGAGPGLVASLSREQRLQLLGTEWYTRRIPY